MAKDRSNFGNLLELDGKERLLYGFTTREGGVSKGPYESLNLALHVGDEKESVYKNREILSLNLKLEKNTLIFMEQVHGDEVVVVDEDFYSRYQKEPFYPKCDAIITHLKNVALCVMVADCVPVLLVDVKNRAIAAVHAGRAGVCKKIVSKTIEKFRRIYKSKSDDIRVFLGPSIATSCYEVGDLNFKEFKQFNKNNKFALKEAICYELSIFGIKNIFKSKTCTHCDSRYFSYRRDRICGRNAGFIAII